MIRPLLTRLSTIVAATALCLSGLSATPAQAGDRDLARALAAIAGIAVIGAIVHEKKKDKKKKKYKKNKKRNDAVSRSDDSPFYRAPQQQPRQVYRPRAREFDSYRDDRGYDLKPRPLPKRLSRDLLPGKCFDMVRTRAGTSGYFGGRCLERNYAYADRLPRACAIQLPGVDGLRSGYDARCLRGRGYRLARR